VFCLLLSGVSATTTTFSVTKGEEVTRTLRIADDDRVTIKFSVVGKVDSVITFSLTFPNGTKKEFGKVGYGNYLFVSDGEGTCILHFSNYNSEDKFVTLNYEVQHYIFGVPEMFFFTLIIILVCIAAVAVFILMAKPQ
jgi:hypothetical protein